MKNFFVLLYIMALSVVHVSASSLELFKDQSGAVDIAGGTAHLPVMKQAAKNIMMVNPAIKITVTGGGSGVGVKKLAEGLISIGNTGRPLKEFEVEQYGLVSFPFAIDGVTIIVNPSNPITQLTKLQLKKIFSGKIRNWKEVGGNNAPISLYIREDGSGTREVFEDKVMHKTHPYKKANVFNSTGSIKTAISQDKNAIGYIGIGYLDSSVKGLVVDNMIPTQENTFNGSYTISRLLYMNTKGEPKGITKLFIDYIYSPDGRDIITKAGYIPIERE